MQEIVVFALIGFLAQLVDGALGMAFGVIATTSLLGMGVAPAAASAAVHIAEMFTTAASGASHLYHRNVDWRLVARLVPAGVLGGVLGALVLAGLDGEAVRPLVSLYLAAIGLYIVFRAFRPFAPRRTGERWAPAIGLAGGFLDASGGGGWGPIVSGTLIGRGHAPRLVIGSGNLSEFVVTSAISAAFVASLGWGALAGPTLGLIAGGVLAAPLGGYLAKRAPARGLMLAVGALIVALSAPRILGVF